MSATGKAQQGLVAADMVEELALLLRFPQQVPGGLAGEGSCCYGRRDLDRGAQHRPCTSLGIMPGCCLHLLLSCHP